MSTYSYKHILLIEDSEIDVLVNRRLMELMNFSAHVTITSTAEEAIDFLRHEVTSEAEAPDLILLDMHLPGMSGFDFMEIFNSLPGYVRNKTRIVVLSVFQKQEEIDRLAGYKYVLGQIEKPLSQESLKKIVGWKELASAVESPL